MIAYPSKLSGGTLVSKLCQRLIGRRRTGLTFLHHEPVCANVGDTGKFAPILNFRTTLVYGSFPQFLMGTIS